MGAGESSPAESPYTIGPSIETGEFRTTLNDDDWNDDDSPVQTSYIRTDSEQAILFDEDNNMLEDEEGSMVQTSLVAMPFTGIWSMKMPAGKSPIPRTGQFCAYSSEYQTIFIGYGKKRTGEYLDDVWALNTESLTWSKLKLTGTTVSPREGAVATMMGNYIVVFGGYSGNYFADLHTIDITTGEVMMTDTKGHLPQPRAGGIMAIHKKKLFIWGGENGEGISDLSILEFASLRWTRVQTNVKGVVHAPWCVVDSRIFAYGASKKGGFVIIDMENCGVFESSGSGYCPPSQTLDAGMIRAGNYILYFGGNSKKKWTMCYACDIERLYWFIFFVLPDGESTSVQDGRISSEGIYLLPRTYQFSAVYVEERKEIYAILGHPHQKPPPVNTIYIGDAISSLNLRDDMCAMFYFGLNME